LRIPEKFVVDDSLFLYPSDRPEEVEIYRGPHMGQVPLSSPLQVTISGEVTIKLGDHVTTDHICPSGSKMKYRANIEKYAEFVFEIVDPTFYHRSIKIRDGGKSNIIVAGFSYGQGSSREHAALCPMYLGVRAVVAKSLERIHRSNLINFGIIPFTFVNEADYDWIDQGDELEIVDIRHVLQKNNRAVILDKTKNIKLEVSIELSERERQIILAGGTLPYIKQNLINY